MAESVFLYDAAKKQKNHAQTTHSRVVFDGFFCFVIFFSRSYNRLFPQNRLSARRTALDYTESSRTTSNATPSGTVGEARPAGTSVLRVWRTTGNPGCACGPTKFRNAKSKVSRRACIITGLPVSHRLNVNDIIN